MVASAEVSMVRIVDGDTIVVSSGGNSKPFKVRFLGIDTPEIQGRCERESRLARAASNRTRNLLPKGSKIILRSDKNKFHKDKYGRVLAKIERNGNDIGQILLREGHAKVWRPPPAPRNSWCK